MIAVIVAIQSEFDAIQQLLSEKKEIICKNVSYTTGKISNKEIVLAICGVGKVAAAICCCRLLENFEIDYVVNIGTAGGIKEYENIGDVMVADKLTYHDYDTSAFDNYSIGFAQNPYVFYSDEKLVKKASSLLNDGLHQVFVGPLVSKDMSENAWMLRNEGTQGVHITPYNFKEVVNLDKTAEIFIKRMISHCSYLLDEEALPNNSILYSEFKVLNELKQIKVNGEHLNQDEQHKIIEELFMKTSGTITENKFREFLANID